MTYNPAKLVELGHFWTGQGGVNLGVVGDTGHVSRGVSYHLGKSQLTSGAYSIQTARDKAGLTEAASAIDLGRLDGTLGHLRTFSIWLVDQARHNKPGTSDLREIIYSPDGKTVLRWDRQRGFASAPRAGEADDTHLTHTHVSWYRDAEHRDHTVAFRPYFAAPTIPTGDTMPNLTTYLPGYLATIKKTSNIRSAPSLSGPLIRTGIPAPESWVVTGWVTGEVDPADGSNLWLTRWNAGAWEYTAHSNVSAGPTAPVGDCSAAVKAATDPLNAEIATLTADVAAATLAGAQAEWDRQEAGATVDVELLGRP